MGLGVGTLVSLVVGIVIAIGVVIGGVSLITPSANPVSASDQIVRYDAP